MPIDTAAADEILATAIAATRGTALHDALDLIPAAIYVTDGEGVITHYNRACIELAGRTPQIRHDKWCVTWKLYTTDGDFLPHDQCPMAVAIKEQRPVRGEEAVAERPDGTRFAFVPYPTPLFDEDGAFAGAINLLIDVTEQRHRQHLVNQARRCRSLANSCDDQRTAHTLKLMASEYEEQVTSMKTPH